jgi:hypothetical protein
MAVDLSSAFDQLAEPDYWTDVVLVFAGFMGAMVAKAAVENLSGQNLPDEVYGVGVAGIGLSMGYPMVAVGGGVHAVNNLAGTLGVQSTIVGMAGGA